MFKKIIKRIFIIVVFYIIFVLVAPDLALKMDKKLKININNKIINIKDKLVFAFSGKENIKKSIDSIAEKLDSKTKMIDNKLQNPTPNLEKKEKEKINILK